MGVGYLFNRAVNRNKSRLKTKRENKPGIFLNTHNGYVLKVAIEKSSGSNPINTRMSLYKINYFIYFIFFNVLYTSFLLGYLDFFLFSCLSYSKIPSANVVSISWYRLVDIVRTSCGFTLTG